jgi:hypothetical protein
MPSLDDIYRKFGEAAEAAQLLETELGTRLLVVRSTAEGLFTASDAERAADVHDSVNRHTLGQLLKGLKVDTESIERLDLLFADALRERNRLFHSFYRHHNFRRNSDEGRAIMLRDLEAIHDTLLCAYKAVMLLSGVDLDARVEAKPEVKHPTGHVPI